MGFSNQVNWLALPNIDCLMTNAAGCTGSLVRWILNVLDMDFTVCLAAVFEVAHVSLHISKKLTNFYISWHIITFWLLWMLWNSHRSVRFRHGCCFGLKWVKMRMWHCSSTALHSLRKSRKSYTAAFLWGTARFLTATLLQCLFSSKRGDDVYTTGSWCVSAP